jgi:prepilin-type processing-associated H-X9-DG protein
MQGDYRCVAGADWGRNVWGPGTGDHDENWDDATQVAHWLMVNHGESRGAMHACLTQAAALTTSGDKAASPAEKLINIRDGLSNTMLVGEYMTAPLTDGTNEKRRTFWAYAYTSYNESCATYAQSRTLLPDFNLCVNTPPGGDNQCKRAWGSYHPNGIINFVFCDGSVHPISPNIDMNFVFPSLATINGGEVIPGNAF